MRCHRYQIDSMLARSIQTLGHMLELVLRLVPRCLDRPIVAPDYLPVR
jgi:hypothetical protein